MTELLAVTELNTANHDWVGEDLDCALAQPIFAAEYWIGRDCRGQAVGRLAGRFVTVGGGLEPQLGPET